MAGHRRGRAWAQLVALLALVAATGRGDDGGEETCAAAGGPPACAAAAAAAAAADPPQARPQGVRAVLPGLLRPEAEPRPAPQADLLDQELEHLESLRVLSKERIRLLEELQGSVEAGSAARLLSQRQAKTLDVQMPLVSEVEKDLSRLPSAASEDYLVSRGSIELETAAQLLKFVPQRVMDSAAEDMAMPTELLVVASADGAVRIFVPVSGDLVCSFAAGHGDAVTHLATSPAQGDNLVVTGDAGGNLRIHRLTVNPQRIAIERSGTQDAVPLFAPLLSVSSKFVAQMKLNGPSRPVWGSEVPSLTALVVTLHMGARYIVTGDSDGQVSVFSKGGDLLAKLDATLIPGAGVRGLDSRQSHLLFYSALEWGYVDLEGLDVKHVDCPDFEGQVVDAVIDSQQPSRVFVANETGSIFVFRIGNAARLCRLELLFLPGEAEREAAGRLDLASVRGFALGLARGAKAGRGTMMALNTSHIGTEDVLLEQPSPLVWRRSWSPVRDWAIQRRRTSEDGPQGEILAFLSESGTSVEVMELLMVLRQLPPLITWWLYVQWGGGVGLLTLALGLLYLRFVRAEDEAAAKDKKPGS